MTNLRSKLLIRFDDVVDDMEWNNFLRIKRKLEEYDIKAILAVVPDSRDDSLSVSTPRSDFRELLSTWSLRGDIIAQHGTHHLYTTKDSGILGINNYSEFAGHDYNYQYSLLLKGKIILQSMNLWSGLFVAPAHSFDETTLRALHDLGFTCVSDGFSLRQFSYRGIRFLPQLTSRPLPFVKGLQTICVHVNTMSRSQVEELLRFIDDNHRSFITPQEAFLRDAPKSTLIGIESLFFGAILSIYRYWRSRHTWRS